MIDFILVITAQALLFLLVSQFNKPAESKRKILFWSCLVGVPFGVAFDLLVGSIAGVYTYVLGFTPLFLFFNGLLSFGIFIAHVWILHHQRFWTFYFNIVLLAIAYELTNNQFVVWQWQFTINQVWQWFVLIFAAYPGLAYLSAIGVHFIQKVSFPSLHLETSK